MSYRPPRYSPLGSMCSRYRPTHLRHSASFSGVSTKPPGGSVSVGLSVSLGQVNLVDTTAPMPTLEAKSSPPSESSTWSPAKLLPDPISAFMLLPLVRTCHEDSGSDAGYWSVAGRLWKANAVPHGQSSITASGLASCAALWMAIQKSDRRSEEHTSELQSR